MTALYGWLQSVGGVIDFRADNLWTSADFIQINLLLVLIAGNCCVSVWVTNKSFGKRGGRMAGFKGPWSVEGQKVVQKGRLSWYQCLFDHERPKWDVYCNLYCRFALTLICLSPWTLRLCSFGMSLGLCVDRICYYMLTFGLSLFEVIKL